jgi:hypothetical protein
MSEKFAHRPVENHQNNNSALHRNLLIAILLSSFGCATTTNLKVEQAQKLKVEQKEEKVDPAEKPEVPEANDPETQKQEEDSNQEKRHPHKPTLLKDPLDEFKKQQKRNSRLRLVRNNLKVRIFKG